MLRPTDKPSQLPDWISDYRVQSWQMEILIAGGTVLSLAAITGFFKAYFFQHYPIAQFGHYSILLLFAVYLVTRVLLIGFIANLILRSVWLAYLGINFSFPDGVNYKRVTNERAKRQLQKQPNILERVTILERLCNLSYSLAILLAILVASAFISLIFITYVFELLGAGDWVIQPSFAYIVSFLIIFIQIGLLDRVLLRSSRRAGIPSKFSKYLSAILSVLTLSFLFKREILVIKTNTNRLVSFAVVLTVLGLASIISAKQIGEYWPYGTLEFEYGDARKFFDIPYVPVAQRSDYEPNLSESKVAFRAAIQSEVIKDDQIKLFLVSWRIFDEYLEYTLNKNNYPLEKIEDQKNHEVLETRKMAKTAFDKSINELFEISIGDEIWSGLQWRNFKHPVTEEEGYLTYLDIKDLPRGDHTLRVQIHYFDQNDSIISGQWEEVAFWRD